MIHGRLRRRGAVPGVAHARSPDDATARPAGRARELEPALSGIQRLHGERAGSLGALLRHPEIEPRSAPLDQWPTPG